MRETQPSPRNQLMLRVSRSIWKKFPHKCWLADRVLRHEVATRVAEGHNGEHWGSYNTRSGRIYAFKSQAARDEFAKLTGAELP